VIATIVVFLAQALTASVPIVLAALGGTISERSGVPTISLEGYVLGGAFGAAAAGLATDSTAVAVLAGAATGTALGAVFALGVVTYRANAIVTGVAVNLLAVAGTRIAIKVLYDSSSNSPPLLTRGARAGSLAVAALLDSLARPLAWLTPIAVLAVFIVLSRTVYGLRVSAAGEHPEACRSLGISIERVRWGALTSGGTIAALGGAHLSLSQHQFVSLMSGGRGFLSLAAVILGGWHPLRVCLAALCIGTLQALEATLAGRVSVPPAWLQALPFAATLLAVVGLVGKTRPPRALG
jgi:ABC-type uncharacterized transport system permease subunit